VIVLMMVMMDDEDEEEEDEDEDDDQPIHLLSRRRAVEDILDAASLQHLERLGIHFAPDVQRGAQAPRRVGSKVLEIHHLWRITSESLSMRKHKQGVMLASQTGGAWTSTLTLSGLPDIS
jgi:hypothetical protein